jgi:hypothetical protein
VPDPTYSRVRRPRPWDARGDSLVQLADAASIRFNPRQGNLFRVVLGGNRTLATPQSAFDGAMVTLEIVQDATGSRTLTLATGAGGFAFGTDAPSGAWVLSTTAGAVDVATFLYRQPSDRWLVLGLIRGY